MPIFKTYPAALTIVQRIKRVFINALRIRAREVVAGDVLDVLSSKAYRITKQAHGQYQISKGSDIYFLRKGASDIHVFNQVILEGEYENLVTLVDRYFQRDQVKCIVDAGANIGFTSRYLQERFSNASILAIEPAPENFEMLKLNVSDKKIVPMHAALYTETTKMVLANDFRDREAWSLRVKPDATGNGSIDAITLDQVLKKSNAAQIDIFKMDIEGGEKALLDDRTFCEMLKKIKFIAFELHEEVVDRIKVVNQLQSLGFELIYKGETLFGVNKSAL